MMMRCRWSFVLALLLFLLTSKTSRGFSSPHFQYQSSIAPSLWTRAGQHQRFFLLDGGREHDKNYKKRRRSSATVLQASFVNAQDTWGNWAVLLGTAAASQVLGKTTPLGRLLGPPVTAMAVSFGLATVGILHPGGTAAALALQTLALQLATPLILMGADFENAISRCGPMLLSFVAASTATTIACVLGWKLAGSWLQLALGRRDGLVLAAALLAKNIGGGINYIAVCTSLNASPTAIAAGLCVDNLFALVYFPITSALAAGRPDVVQVVLMDQQQQQPPLSSNNASETSNREKEVTADSVVKDEAVTVQSVSNVLCIAAALLWVGQRLGGTSGALPVTTILTVLLASRAPSSFMVPLQPAASILGTCGLYVFFATAGAPGIAVADSVRASLLPLGLFLTTLYSVHGFILVACHKFLFGKSNNKTTRFGEAFAPQRLLVASSAAIGGPATAVALAQAANWQSLLVPSLIVGNIGYAVATFCGLAYYALFAAQ